MIKIDDIQLKDFLDTKPYSDATKRRYAEYMRRVNREGLTLDGVNLIYENHSQLTRSKLRMAIKHLKEFKEWCDACHPK